MIELITQIFIFLGALIIVMVIIGAVIFLLSSIVSLFEWIKENEHLVATSIGGALLFLVASSLVAGGIRSVFF